MHQVNLMKILHLNTSDVSDGASRAVYRLHRGLVALGVDSNMLVQNKSISDYRVIGPRSNSAKVLTKLRSILDKAPLFCYRNRSETIFSPAWVPNLLPAKIRRHNPDIVHLHWIGGGFIPIEMLRKINTPIVWTLHDMWAFTGGCHYDEWCGRYITECHSCPALGSSKRLDLAYLIWKRKLKFWQGLPLTLVTPSRWLADCVSVSKVLGHYPVEVIHNGLDLSLYKPTDKTQARGILGLPKNKKLVLFGAMTATNDNRKGFRFLQTALQKIAKLEDRTRYAILVFGASEPKKPPDLGFETYYLGHLHDDISLALLYSAADVFVLPSKQDNLPNTILEALACGTPSVAFNIGGTPDMIKHKINGYVAKPLDTDDLAAGIRWVLAGKERHAELSKEAREKAVASFALEKIGKKYISLYQSTLTRWNNRRVIEHQKRPMAPVNLISS